MAVNPLGHFLPRNWNNNCIKISIVFEIVYLKIHDMQINQLISLEMFQKILLLLKSTVKKLLIWITQI